MKNPANRRFAEADGNEKNGKALTTSALGSESHVYDRRDTHERVLFFTQRKRRRKSRRERNKNIAFCYIKVLLLLRRDAIIIYKVEEDKI